MEIAMIQMQANNEVKKNIKLAFEYLTEASKRAKILVLPELWTHGANLKNIKSTALDENDKLFFNLSELAKKNKVIIIAGSIPIRINNRIFNRLKVFDDKGKCIINYDKIHLYANEERSFFTAGNKVLITEFYETKVGFAICYDLSFPEIFRKLREKGIEIVFLVAAWPVYGKNNWKILTRARAIENRTYLCATNLIGGEEKVKLCGNSTLVSPTGTVLVKAKNNDNIIYGRYNKKLLESTREKIDMFKDRKIEIY